MAPTSADGVVTSEGVSSAVPAALASTDATSVGDSALADTVQATAVPPTGRDVASGSTTVVDKKTTDQIDDPGNWSVQKEEKRVEQEREQRQDTTSQLATALQHDRDQWTQGERIDASARLRMATSSAGAQKRGGLYRPPNGPTNGGTRGAVRDGFATFSTPMSRSRESSHLMGDGMEMPGPMGELVTHVAGESQDSESQDSRYPADGGGQMGQLRKM